MPEHAYWAFISYSRHDSATAQWLHRALENYVVPRRLIARDTPAGPAPKRFRPIFRDRTEVAAGGELHARIEEAISQAAYLIVVCSPHAAASSWVNEEIARFRASHCSSRILTVITEASPACTDLCFPPALGHSPHAVNPSERSEPIAADLRRGGDGRRLVLLRIVAGMLGVGLDDLVRRDDLRRRRHLITISACSISGMAIMAALALAAVLGRNDAQQQRAHAEGLIEFMLTDLRKTLESNGRIDLMDGVGAEALKYYQSQDSRNLDSQSLARRARALRLMGEIRIQRGDLGDALAGFQQASASTAELLARSPRDPQSIFNHAQNVFWVGEIARQRGDLPAAESSFRDYRRLAENLAARDPENDDWRAEVEYSQSALGVLFLEQGRSVEAITAFERTLVEAKGLAHRHPDDLNRQIEVAQGHAWLADALQKRGRLFDTRYHREQELAIYQATLEKQPTLRQAKSSTVVALQVIGRLALIEGDLDGALTAFSDAVMRAEALLLDERENMDLTAVVAIARVNMGEALLAAGKISEAETAQKRGSELLSIALAHDSSVVSWRNYHNRADLLEAALAAHLGNIEVARELDQTVLSRLGTSDERGLNTEPFWLLQRARLQLGNDLSALGHAPEARTQWNTIVKALGGPLGDYEPQLLLVLEAADLKLGQQAAAQAIKSYIASLYARPGNLEAIDSVPSDNRQDSS